MNVNLTSLFSAVIASGAVSSLIVYLAKSWITERLKHAIAHEYAQKLEAHRAALKSDYDVQLERLRAECGAKPAIEASARSALPMHIKLPTSDALQQSSGLGPSC